MISRPEPTISLVVPSSTLAPEVGVRPSTNLATEQLVTVTASGFPPSSNVAVLLCRSEVSATRSADDCDRLSTVAIMTDASGSFETEYLAQRYISIGGREVDCGAPLSCGIVVAAVPDTSIAAGAAIEFGDSSETDLPILLVDTVLDGAEIRSEIAGSQFMPASTVFLTQCVLDDSGDAFFEICDADGGVLVLVDDTGSFSVAMVPVRAFQDPDGNLIDCLEQEGTCGISTGPIDEVNRIVTAPLNVRSTE